VGRPVAVAEKSDGSEIKAQNIHDGKYEPIASCDGAGLQAKRELIDAAVADVVRSK